jgi:hypothetical protein
MGTITTLRPSATSSAVGWSAQPSGTIHAATSDDNDSTYALWSGSGSPLILATPADAPPVGERRHQARLRMRGEDGDAWGAVRLASGGLVAGAAAQFSASPGTITGAWGTGVPADGSTVLSTYVTAQSSVVRIEELYLDVDSRLAPTFTLAVLDSTGTPSVAISDTAQPTITAGTPDLDDLSARQYRFWVTLNGAIVWDTGVTSGPATNRVTTALDNGTYVAHGQVWSTLGSNTAYASDEETVTFTISVGAVQSPEQPTVTPVDGTPFYEIEACAPYAGDFDDAEAWLEIQRVDCPIGGYLDLPGIVNGYASAPSAGAPTDLQITVSAQRDDDWRSADNQMLVTKYVSAGDQRSFVLAMGGESGVSDPSLIGQPYVYWTEDGTDATSHVVGADTRPPIDAFGRVTLRVLIQPDTGGGNWAVTFFTMDADGAWVQLGDVQTGTGSGDLFWGTGDLQVGVADLGSFQPWDGRIYWAEVRDGSAGPILASPDFTGRAAGTTSFTDDQVNTWSVHAPATITSDQRITSVAILGPLATDECATYTDYSLPRTGVGVTCEHTPDPCCSYYRARTLGRVDGALQVSDWSDAYDPGIPNGLIFLWPSTNASIPAGWDRVTELDATYPKGIPDGSTQPGTTGGAALHTHSLTAHSHDTSHGHTVTGASSAAVGSFSSSDGAVGTTAIAASHTHTIPAANSATVPSGSTAPSVDFPNNDLDRFFQIFVKSNGQPLGLANGMVGIAPDISMSGWTNYANSEERFLKGAAPGGDGGTASSSTLNNHTHAIGAHTHASASHSHTHNNASTVTSNLSLFAGASSAVWSASHAHAVTGGSTNSGSLASGGSGTSGASSLGATEPPHTRMRFKLNTSGGLSLPVGIIGIWRGSLGSIPSHWELCDGTSGKPNLLGQYVKGAATSIGTTGGSLNPHNHTSPSHTHTTTSHTHTITVGTQTGAVANVSTTATVSVANGTHTHTHGATDATTPTVGSSTSGTLVSTTTEPLHEEVAFVQLVEEPTPPPAPEEFCLVWNDDEHLIRSENSQGPMFAAIGGIFTWDVDRPFTSATGVMGGQYVTSAPPGGRNLHLTTAVEGEEDLAQLLNVLNRPLVLISPSDAAEVWAAPVGSSVKIIKIGRVRQVTADFIATGPQPAPQLADVGA